MSETQEVKYSSYTQAQKKASQLYRLKNKDKINEQRKKYYLSRKELDPKFLEYKRMKAKEYYEKKKLDKVVIPDVEMKDASTQVEVPDVIMNEPVLVPEMVQETKMEIDSPEISTPMTNPLKGKRMTKSKKLKTELVVKV